MGKSDWQMRSEVISIAQLKSFKNATKTIILLFLLSALWLRPNTSTSFPRHYRKRALTFQSLKISNLVLSMHKIVLQHTRFLIAKSFKMIQNNLAYFLVIYDFKVFEKGY